MLLYTVPAAGASSRSIRSSRSSI